MKVYVIVPLQYEEYVLNFSMQNDYYQSFARKFPKFHKVLKDLNNCIFVFPCTFTESQNIDVYRFLHTGIQKIQISHGLFHVEKYFTIYTRCMICLFCLNVVLNCMKYNRDAMLFNYLIYTTE